MELMCAYGNCHNTMVAGKDDKVTVTISSRGKVDDRQSFCCEKHASLWLNEQDAIRIRNISRYAKP